MELSETKDHERLNQSDVLELELVDPLLDQNSQLYVQVRTVGNKLDESKKHDHFEENNLEDDLLP